MKKRLVLFAFACVACLALFTCENQQVIGILRSPTELTVLDITAYADEYPIRGGATLEPTLRPGVFKYTVHVSKDANSFKIDASIGAAGTVTAYSEEDQRYGTEFDYVGDNPKIITLTVQRQYMDLCEYRLTVVRVDTVPVAEDIHITVDPPIGTFFIGRGVLPKIKVTANLPAAGGELSYQWYMNTENISVDGYPISEATGDTYTMKPGETETVRTVYYYAEITNTIDGKTGVTVSPPQAVTFINKGNLDVKSLSMTDIPAGSIRDGIYDYSWYDSCWLPNYFEYTDEWSTPGFKMGQYLVTWELWKTVSDYADAGGYRLSRRGNQGAAVFRGNTGDTNGSPKPIGNKLNPVTNIGWREAVVWCNAYSEMDGFEQVYRDKDGNVLRDSREAIELLLDESKIDNYNGYRLPTAEEWIYAARGANPSAASPWTDNYPGTLWLASPGLSDMGALIQTTEVGSLEPNSAGLYDILGMVNQWVWWSAYGTQAINRVYTYAYGSCIKESNVYGLNDNINPTQVNFGLAYNGTEFNGFRIVQGGNK